MTQDTTRIRAEICPKGVVFLHNNRSIHCM